VKLALEFSFLILLLAIIAFFSVSETSLFSLRAWRLERLRRENPHTGRIISRLLSDPLRLLITLVIGTELSSIATGNLTAMMRRDYFDGFGETGVAIALVSTSALLLLFGEITPKSLAANFPEWTAARIARPFAAATRLLAPFSVPLAWLAKRFPAGSRTAEGDLLTEADFRIMVEMGQQEGELDPKEVEMIGAVFRLGDLPVHAVMVPRTDIAALPASITVEQALAEIRRRRHSRVPIFEGDLDHIVGILYAKDLLGLDGTSEGREEIRKRARPAFFVPEKMRARQLIREFQTRRLHLAVVVDEYGGTSGIASLEDLLEEIVGDISDDFDRPLAQHRQIRRGLDWARGSLPFGEFKRKFRARARAGPFDTLGGYALKLFGRVPAEGESISDGQFTFTVARMGKRRIQEIMIERAGPGEKKGPGTIPGPRSE